MAKEKSFDPASYPAGFHLYNRAFSNEFDRESEDLKSQWQNETKVTTKMTAEEKEAATKLNYKNAFQHIDFANSIPRGFATKRLHCNKVILNAAVPKHWRYSFDAKSLQIDSVVYLLSDAVVLDDTIKLLQSTQFVEKFFEVATNAKSGLFYTNTALLTYDLIVSKIIEVASSLSLPSSSNATLVMASLLIDVLNELGIIAYSGGSYALVTKTKLFADYSDLVTEMRKARLTAIISTLDKTRIKTTSKMGVGILSSLVGTTFSEMAISLVRLKTAEQDLENVFCLVRAYTLSDYALYTQDEIVIFEDPQFLEFATNITFVIAAMETGNKTRPISGSFYWQQLLSRVTLELRSSSAITITDMNSVKEYFHHTIINDEHGMKKGVILTKNLKDETPFEPYFITRGGAGYVRIQKDAAAEMSLSGVVGQLKEVESETLHTYFVKMFGLITTSKAPNFVFPSFCSTEDVVHLAIAHSSAIELASFELAEGVYHHTLCYEVATRESRIAEDISTLGVAKLLNPFAVLFFTDTDDFAGKKMLSFNEPVIAETERMSYSGLDRISTSALGKTTVIDMKMGGSKIRTAWRLDHLLSMPSLENTLIIQPVIGRLIISKLVKAYSDIDSISKLEFGMGSEFQLTMALSFAKIIEPMFMSQDITQITSSAISDMWDDRAKLIKSDPTTANIIRSAFYDQRYKKEMQFTTAFFVASATGFINDGNLIKSLAAILEKGGVFNHM